MFMRFFGAGVGHKATNKYTDAFRKDALAMANTTQSNTDPIVGSDLQIPDSEEAQLAEEQDYGYEIGGDSEDDESLDELEDDGADLGAEDGEEPWDMDDLYVEGYDEL
jgi:hypothetical protein